MRKKIKAVFAAALTLLISTNSAIFAMHTKAYAEATEGMAYLDYDESTGSYSLLKNNGVQFGSDYYMTAAADTVTIADDQQETTATTTAATEQVVTTTSTVKTGTIVLTTATTVTTMPYSPAGTVPDYTGRYRNEALDEWEKYLASYTTTTTTTTTTIKKVYKGIDVSRHQGNINWEKVKAAGVEFVMIRAGYGMESDQVDGKFHANIQAAQKLGIECGVYWYSYALNADEALREAKLCYNTIKDYKLSYPVSFDIEDPSQKHLTKAQISEITKTFCDYLESKNYYVSVYSYASMLTDKMTDAVLSDYDIWVAHVNVDKPSFSKPYGMWQYSWTGRVNGITGDVDLDYAYKNYPYIIKNSKLSGNT